MFERAYKAKNYDDSAQENLNTEIVRLIAQNSADIMLNNKLFLYCFFYCIYYNHRKLAMILTTLLSKLEMKDPELEYILDLLDQYGIDAIKSKANINCQIYHLVMYRAIEDQLRVIYKLIINKLPILQLRNSDVREFIKNEDWKLVKLILKKKSKQIAVPFYKSS